MREVLRLGTHQLLATRVQPHAAVATSVNLVKEAAGQRPAGFVNAVLRRVVDQGPERLAGDRRAGPRCRPARPSRRPVQPPALDRRAALAAALGEQLDGDLRETEAALAADTERPAVHLCAVPGLADQQELVAAGCSPARWSPFGGYLASGDPAAIAGGRGRPGRRAGRGQPARGHRGEPGRGGRTR